MICLHIVFANNQLRGKVGKSCNKQIHIDLEIPDVKKIRCLSALAGLDQLIYGISDVVCSLLC
jgi:hypothetical protein